MSINTVLIDRLKVLLRRRRAAARLGLRYKRAATFGLPQYVRLGGRWVALSIPDESGQETAFVELLLDDCYGLRRVANMVNVRTVVDIGANIGLFGVATRASFPDARIHAYEPNVGLESALSYHAAELRFEYFIEAVGKESGMVSLLIDPQQSIMTKTRLDQEGNVPQIALSEALRRLGGYADLVKLDCEGAEWELFDDLESWKRVNYITMEYHLDVGDGHDRIESALKRIGFSIIDQKPATDFGLALAVRG